MSDNPYRAAGTYVGLSYVERAADRLLLDAIEDNRRFPYVLAPRQSGKSSLLTRTMRLVARSGIRSAFVDLSTFPSTCFSDYSAFIKVFIDSVIDELGVAPHVGGRSFLSSLTQVLRSIAGRVVIFIDEIDALLAAPFKDDFLSLIRAIFNRRATDDIKRVQFVLAGAVEASRLISTPHRSPFNVGVEIKLDDCSLAEVETMAAHLTGAGGQIDLRMLSRMIFRYTSGSVYLTQLILEDLWDLAHASRGALTLTAAAVDRAVARIISTSGENVHFTSIHALVRRDPLVLDAIAALVAVRPTRSDARASAGMTGLIGAGNRIRNEIYRRVFGPEGPLMLFGEALPSVARLNDIRIFSPFHVGNALPEDSPVFVGRSVEINLMLEGLRRYSFLIVGARQMGKTSLLRRVYGLARSTGRYTPFWLDAAGFVEGDDLLRQLCSQLGSTPSRAGDLRSHVASMLRACTYPVLFLNEVDGLCTRDVGFLTWLRMLSESGVCQCVFTGYLYAFASTRDVSHPFFHFTRGRSGERAFALGPLERASARELIARLEADPLALSWDDGTVRSEAIEKMLRWSGRMPFLLQMFCDQIVELLSQERRLVITGDDVERAIMKSGHVTAYEFVHRTLSRIRWGEESFALGSWVAVVLATLVRRSYGDVIDLEEIDETALDAPLDISLGELPEMVRSEVQAAISRIPRALDEKFPRASYERLIDELTMRAIVERAAEQESSIRMFAHHYLLALHERLRRKRQSFDQYVQAAVRELVEALEEGRHDET